MALTKTGSPTTILKVAEVEKEEDKKVLKVIASRPEKETKVGGTD